jgi:hypothetical protein
MAKRSKALLADGEPAISDKSRANPIKSTIRKVGGLHRSAILYRCEASSFWQFRVYFEGKLRKRSTQELEYEKAQRKAKLIFSEMLASIHSGETKAEPTSRRSLDLVAKSLWAKNETRIKNKELNASKVSKDTYVFERHIKPFFARYDIKDIDLDLLEQFKSHLTNQGLSPATQVSYLNLVHALLKEAQAKRLIATIPQKPRVRTDDGVRGYFDNKELSELRQWIGMSIDRVYELLDTEDKIYRKIKVTHDLLLAVDFMLETYIRPTDIKVLKHEDVRLVKKEDITFLVLEHEKTKLHKKNMVSTERGLIVYKAILDHRGTDGAIAPNDYLFMPDYPHRDTALRTLSSQFAAVIKQAGMDKDRHGKPRTLYSLRHTAIVRSLRKGIPIELVASNARTSTDMIRRFYGTHIDNILETGTVYVEKEKALRDQRFKRYDDLVEKLRRVSNDPMYDTSAEREEQADLAKLREMRQSAAKTTEEKPNKPIQRTRPKRKESSKS